MTDRELLELAAKAAGNPSGTSRAGGGLLMANDLYWNPLTDDGDALRLAVKLGLDVCIDTPIEREPHTHVIGFVGNSADTVDVIEAHGDPYAATRRAIVRAAAEIGKGMRPFPSAKEIREEWT
jgi:hypothetical protein